MKGGVSIGAHRLRSCKRAVSSACNEESKFKLRWEIVLAACVMNLNYFLKDKLIVLSGQDKHISAQSGWSGWSGWSVVGVVGVVG